MADKGSTFMVWQSNETVKNYDPVAEARFAVQHYLRKYGGKIVGIKCNNDNIMKLLQEEYPGVQIDTDPQVYHQGIFFICGKVEDDPSRTELLTTI